MSPFAILEGFVNNDIGYKKGIRRKKKIKIELMKIYNKQQGT